jgi:anaerobic magnesium-protoporphyrin IX monomethyl ester cyclase
MRIALIYPPPWKIPDPEQPPDPADGPPPDFQVGDLDPDFWQMPYGLLSLAAQASRAGHQVKVMNLSAFTWSRTREIVAGLKADLWGMSCWTANRRGVALLAQLIRRHHPDSHIVVGGPHASPLAEEMLAHHAEIDTVSLGESEAQFLELVERLDAGESTVGIAGTVYRNHGQLERGPRRPAIANLNALASPHEYFDTHIVMTSRGCPWECTFCGAASAWGRGHRTQSTEYVLDALALAVERASVKQLQIKDDTFTTNKRRVLELCRGIRARGLDFLWSCDTRVDVINEELLREMRLAGCQRLSLGVESGSPAILRNIDKKITPEKIIESTEMAKRVGIQVRYFMMLGNRGETAETFRESLAFLKRAQPHQYIFSCLSIYPGTRDFRDAEADGRLDRETYFTGKFQELKTPFDASDEDAALMNEWFLANRGVRNLYVEGIAECQAVLRRLGEHHAAHLDLACAYYRARTYDLAEQHARRAVDLGHPTPGLAYNTLACIAFARGDVAGMQDHLLTAAKLDPQHPVLVVNVHAVREWLAQDGAARGLPLELAARTDFQLLERNVQPALPGPIGDDFADWRPLASSRTPVRARITSSSRRASPKTVAR